MVKIQTTLSPHIVDGKPRGYYLIAQRLFTHGLPILRRDQFVGFSRGLVVTIERHRTWQSLLDIGLRAQSLGGQSVSWLGKIKMYQMSAGFRMYIPGTILKPTSADSKKIETWGIFDKEIYGAGISPLYYLKVPIVTAEVLLGKERLDK